MMKRSSCTGTLLAFAVAGLSGSALAQQTCDSDIRQLRMQNQERPADERQVQQVSQLLDQAERAGPNNCQQYVTQARQQLQQTPGGQATQQQPQQAQERQGQQQTQQQQGQQQQAQQQPQPEQQGQQQRAQQQQGTERMDVQIEQAPAEVQVEQGAPRVVVRQQPAKVTVEQQPPIVEITQPEADVTVSQAEPQVRINQAEPEIEVQSAEAEVEVQQAGEPIVRMVGPESQGQQAAAGQQQAGSQQQGSDPQQQRAAELIGRTVLTDQGDEVGDVKSIVRSETDNELRAVVDVGGFLGIGEREIAIPIDRGEVTQTGHLRLSIGRQELEQMEDYDPAQYTEVR